MTVCYSIKDWDKHFENSESRRYKALTWVPMKNKHDGKSYRRVAQHPKSVQVFCAWSLIVQVASKMPTRGLLRDDDGPLTASDLAAKTGFPEVIFEIAFEVLTDSKIGWLGMDCARQLPQMPADAQQNPVEQNRTEQNEEIKKAKATCPTLEEVKEYGKMIGASESDSVAFWNHFESVGWVNKHNQPILRWQSKLHTWKTENQQTAHINRPHPAQGASRTEMSLEYQRVIEKLRKIKDGAAGDAAGNRFYTPLEKNEMKRLKARRDELKALLKIEE